MGVRYSMRAKECVCQTWDRGSVWHANAVEGHHAGCRLLAFDAESRKRVAGMTPLELHEMMGAAQGAGR